MPAPSRRRYFPVDAVSSPRRDYKGSSSYIAPCPTANNHQPNPNSATNSQQPILLSNWP
jgi:hypothetical protein